MNLHTTTYILSAELSTLSDNDNFTRTESLESTLKGLGVRFKRVLGSFKGRKEVAFCIVGCDESTVIDLVKAWGQECALVLDAARLAYLIDGTGVSKLIGKFKVVPEDIALRHDAWTFDNVTGQYFVVE